MILSCRGGCFPKGGRPAIGHLVPRLRSVAIGKAKAVFGEALRRAEVAAEAANLPRPEIPQSTDGQPSADKPSWAERKPFHRSAVGFLIQLNLDPEGMIEQAWRDLRQDLVAALHEQGYDGLLNHAAINEYLIASGRLPHSASAVLDELEQLRVATIMAPSVVDPESAQRFVELTDRLRRALRFPKIAAGGADSHPAEST